jgi:hypothetical protein
VPEAATSRRTRIGVLLGGALLLLAGLGRVGAWAPDEPRYLQVAEERLLRTARRARFHERSPRPEASALLRLPRFRGPDA